MVSQNAGGTALTIAGDVLIDTNANALLTLDGASGSTEGIIIKHSGTEVSRISHSASTSLVFSTGSSVTTALTIDNSQNSTFAGAVTAPSVLANGFMEIRSDTASLYFENAANNNYYRLKRSSNNFVIDYYDGATTSDRLTIDSSGDATFAGNLDATQLKAGTSTSFMRISSNQIYKETNGSAGWMYITGSVVQLQGTGTGNVIVGSNSQTTSNKTLSVRCDSNSVSALAAMSHQTYYAGGATKQGGIYTGTQTINNATQTSIFTLTANALIFDVMLTCRSFATNYQPVYITKKYSVARTTGQTSPNYFKIIDSGPGVGTGGAPTRDFTVDFVGDSTTGLECKITGSGGTTHEIHYTIIIGNVTSESSLGVTGY
jgi:hypothetical protein